MSDASVLPQNPPPLPAGAAPPPINLRDFPDRLTPMLVKELRQGMRSQVFVWGFLVLHAVLVLVTLITLNARDKEDSSYFFWWALILVMVVLIPLRGFNALAEEQRMNTLDTLVLTKLTAWRITFGKWCAILAQSGLIAVTVLPYLVMRYFGGAVDVARELLWLLNYLIVAATFAAATVGFSWIKNFFVRGIFTLSALGGIIAFCAFTCSEILVERGFSYSRGIAPVEIQFYSVFWGTALFLTFYLLDMGAAQLAPLSENRSSLRRLVTLAVAAGVTGLCFADLAPLALALVSALTLLGGIDAATEEPRHLSVIYRPFVNRGMLGRLAGRLFYPGWHTGTFFLLLLLSLTFFAVFATTDHLSSTLSRVAGAATRWHWELVAAFAGGSAQLLCGLVVQRLLFKRTASPFATQVLIQAAMQLLLGLLVLLGDSLNENDLVWIGFPFPLSANYRLEMGPRGLNTETTAMVSLLYLAIYAAALMALTIPEFKKTRHAERSALEEGPPPTEDPI